MEKEESETTTAAKLPFDVLVSIFRFLDTDSKGKAAQVCLSWGKAANSKSLWKTLKINLQFKHLSIQSERSIVNRGIRQFDLDIFEPRFNEFLRRNHELEYLRFTGCRVKENMLKFLKTAPNFEEILSLAKSVGSNRESDFNISDEDKLLEDIAVRLPSLHKLNPHGCIYNNHGILKTFTSGMRKLKELYLDGCCYDLEGVADLEISNHIVEKNIKHEDPLISLEKLCFRNVPFFKEETFLYISQKFVNLVTLTAEFCPWIADGGLVHLLKLKNLKFLSFAFSEGIMDEGFKHISRLTALKSFNLSRSQFFELDSVTEGCIALTSRLINLTNLTLVCCSTVTDATLKQINALPHLQELDIHSCIISDAGLLNLASGSLKLTKLDISFIYGISDQGLLYIIESSFASVLSHLEVNCCDFTDFGIIRIVAKLPNLQVLHLGSCQFVTDGCRMLIAEKMSRRHKKFSICDIEYKAGATERLEELCSYLQPLVDTIV